MSVKFRIKNVSAIAEKEGDTFVRFSGKAEPYTQSSERESRAVGIDAAGNPKLVFNTGLNPESVSLYRWYNEEEQKEVKKQIEDALPIIIKAYGGKDVIEETNAFFWKKKKEVNRFVITHETENFEYDTENTTHLLLYLSIISGAFMDVVAPTKDWAINKGILHYLELQSEENEFDGEEEITKSDAHFALGELRKNESYDALFTLAWCLQYDTASFGAYSKSTSTRNLINYHIQYIDGKLKSKRKINFPKTFLEYVEKWNGQQTRAKLMIEAYVKAGEYYSYINRNKERKLSTVDGVVIGTTIKEAVDNLNKAKFAQDLEKLRDLVEAKWKE